MRETSAQAAPKWPPLVPHFRSWVTRKFRFFFNKNPLLGTLDCPGSELWTPFKFSKSTGLLFYLNVTGRTLIYIEG